MANADLGHKKRCASCGIKFYDMNKKPIICPKCNTQFDPESLLKSKRGRLASKQIKDKPVVPADEADSDIGAASVAGSDDGESFTDEDALPSNDEPLVTIPPSDDNEGTEG